MLPEDKLDMPLYGAEAIGRAAHLLNEDARKTYYVLERGYIDADKFGRQWVSTPRRIRRAFMGGSNDQPAEEGRCDRVDQQ